MLVKAARCLASALTTGVPGGLLYSVVAVPSEDAAFHWIRDIISEMMTKSMIKGEARRESSQMLNILETISRHSHVGGSSFNLRNGLMAAHENLGVVLVESTLVVSDSRHVLDDNAVVGVLALLVKDVVGLNHVINNVRLGDLLRAELLLGAQVLAIIVAEVIVAGNRSQLDTSVDEEVNKGRLHLGLARLEIVATNEGVVLLGKLNGSRDEGVLRRAVDERGLFKDTSNCKHGGRRNLLVSLLNGLEKVVGSIVDTLDQIGVSLSVGSPHDDDLVKAIVGLEVANVLADLLDMSPASLATLENVVGTILLVGSNEVRVVDGGKGDHLSHLLLDLGLEGGFKDLSAVHGLGQVQLADIPASDDQVIGVDHGEDVVEGDVDLLVSLGIMTELEGELAAVGEDTSGDGSSVVASETDQHHADLGDLAVDLEVVEGLIRSSNILAVGINFNLGGAVGVSRANLRISVSNVGGVDGEEVLSSRGGLVAVDRPVRGARADFRVESAEPPESDEQRAPANGWCVLVEG
ncbi:hypothetical protein HG530_006317 [Fusarium avenaceum]|nr:hypothetical protein HG530_006317 [Fusarium avenaceum]